MKITQTARAALLAAGMLVLAGCGGGSGTEQPAATQAPPASESGMASESASPQMSESGQAGSEMGAADTLATAETDLGTIVVDGKGMTVYYYDKDTKGAGSSACEGECAAAWPAVHAASADPEVAGVTGEVGTITGVDGELQVTVDGRPVYTYAADTGPGDVTGQGVNGVWHVVAPDGTEIMDAAPAAGTDY